VVLLDNDEGLLRSLEILISSEGHEVRAFADLRSALAYLGTAPDVDVLVVDHVLGEATSVALLRELIRSGRRVPFVILISGHADLVRGIDLERLGVAAFLPKPIELDRLLQLVAAASTQERPVRTRSPEPTMRKFPNGVGGGPDLRPRKE